MVPVRVGANALITIRQQELEKEIQGILSTIQFFQRKFNECRANLEAQINARDPFAKWSLELMLTGEKEGLEGALLRSPSPDLHEPLLDGELHELSDICKQLQGERRQTIKDFLGFVQNSLEQLKQN